MEPKSVSTAITYITPNLLSVTDEQAKAVKALAEFGTTVVEEGGQLTRYLGRVLGTVPHDTVGLVLGDPLRFVRTGLAGVYDHLLSMILQRRNVENAQPVSPSLAIPLLRAAYDESRPELQKLWSELIAAAVDPSRSGRVRLSFIDTLKRFDPLDALVLKVRHERPESLSPSALEFITEVLKQPRDEVFLSVQNLELLRCVDLQHSHDGRSEPNFNITPYGRALIRVCSD
jgi:hypothetical protein